MEAKLNIANILKDKQKGTKLYADAFGELSFEYISNNIICTRTKEGMFYTFYNNGKYSVYGEPILVPSKEMRDWRKFAWKKGDVLVSNDRDCHIIFGGFSKDDYTTFKGKHWISVSKKRYIYCLNAQDTRDYHIEDDKNATKIYINTIEERLGGKLNLKTLGIEKQPEFKDGDIVTYGKSVAICRKICKHTLFPYVSIDETSRLLFNDNPNVSPYECRFATEEEKQQLFSALENEGKAWDAVKKQIVDLKPKWTPKPFDRVVTRVDDDAIWSANIFSHIDSYGEYVTIGCVGGYPYCLPYNEETAKLIGTSDDWEG